MEIIISFIQRAILQGTPLLFGATGEILTEKSGNLNLGIPGIMYIGAISGVVGGFFYQNSAARVQPVPAILIPLLCCLAGSLLPHRHPQGQSECHRSGHYHLRRRRRQFLRRIPHQDRQKRCALPRPRQDRQGL